MNYTELQCNGHSVKLILENYKYKSVLTAHVHDFTLLLMQCYKSFSIHSPLQKSYMSTLGPKTVTLWNKHVKLQAKPLAEHRTSEPHHYGFIVIKF